MMIVETIVFTVIFTCMVVLGLRLTSDSPDQILYFLRHIGEKLPKWFAKPIILCVTCMNSIYGSLVYALVLQNLARGREMTVPGGSSVYDYILFFVSTWPPAIFGSAFITTILWVSYTLIRTKFLLAKRELPKSADTCSK